jgi:hypothetical protein
MKRPYWWWSGDRSFRALSAASIAARPASVRSEEGSGPVDRRRRTGGARAWSAKVYVGLVYCMAAREDHGVRPRPLIDAGMSAAPLRHSRRSESHAVGQIIRPSRAKRMMAARSLPPTPHRARSSRSRFSDGALPRQHVRAAARRILPRAARSPGSAVQTT